MHDRRHRRQQRTHDRSRTGKTLPRTGLNEDVSRQKRGRPDDTVGVPRERYRSRHRHHRNVEPRRPQLPDQPRRHRRRDRSPT
ncbi:hypothetical protein CH272_23395, partial [Rhodococcus sp. 05-340-1]